jgi:alanine-glyoxylate transaminase / serine-glyoxylate transaminase / serine-pyruvate transaminase
MHNPVFIPGPTNLPEQIRRAVDIPTMDHRSSAFPPMLNAARDGVRSVIKSQAAQVFIFPATGSGGWEAAITNTFSPGDRVLAVVNGLFGQKWVELCKRHRLDVTIIESEWGEDGSGRIANYLTEDKSHLIKAVIATHNETSTGVKADIAGIRGTLDACGHPALLLVDGVSSIGCMDFRFDEWRVDIAVTGSQKGFMLPPGLAIVAFSADAMNATGSAQLSRSYFDITEMSKANSAGGYPYTPPVGLINGLMASCDLLLTEGLEAVFARHHRRAAATRKAVFAWGLELCAQRSEIYSDTVTVIKLPEGADGNLFATHAHDRYGISFGAGLGKLAGKVFRIGHLGSLSDALLLAGLATAEMALVDIQVPITLGSGVAAAQRQFVMGEPFQRKAAA